MAPATTESEKKILRRSRQRTKIRSGANPCDSPHIASDRSKCVRSGGDWDRVCVKIIPKASLQVSDKFRHHNLANIAEYSRQGVHLIQSLLYLTAHYLIPCGSVKTQYCDEFTSPMKVLIQS